MSVEVFSCPCGYGDTLAAETAACPICGMDQRPLRNLIQTTAAVRARLIWTAVMMFCGGLVAAGLVFGVAQMLSRQRQPDATSRPFTVRTEQTSPAPLVSAGMPPVAVWHVVKAGDSWWRISTVHYGNGAFWPYAAGITGNQRARGLTPGQVVELHPICIVPK